MSPPPSPTRSPLDLPDDPSAAAIWDWGNLLDFAVDADDNLLLLWDTPPPDPTPIPADPTPALPPPTLPPSRVRKRDPRLVCTNYLAGRVPCACPEMDEKELEVGEEEVVGGRKRARSGVVNVGVRCQVPGCEADIRELKGYHRRHRVCLRCANVSAVLLDGQEMRYCQQCGKYVGSLLRLFSPCNCLKSLIELLHSYD